MDGTAACNIIVRIECAWHYKGDCPGLRQECGLTLSASFVSLAPARYAEVPRRCVTAGAPVVTCIAFIGVNVSLSAAVI